MQKIIIAAAVMSLLPLTLAFWVLAGRGAVPEGQAHVILKRKKGE